MSSSSSTEEELDLEEIEVALYSQIHYGSSSQALQQECPTITQVDHITTTNLLPFIVTQSVQKSTAQDKCIYVSSEAESPSATPVKPCTIEGRKEVSVLENFLQLSKGDASCKIFKKKKRLSKMEAAIQTFKPLRLRRDPQVVVNTDTDTDTESEDEKSCSRRLNHDKAPVSEVVELTSDSEDDVIEVNPNLDFNLEGGVEALLTAPNLEGGVEALLTAPKGVSNEWRILDEDRYNTNSAVSRYFSNTSVQCRNCKKLGHFLRDCPEPLKRRCVFCALEGHTWQACPNAVCYNCETPGHKGHDCPEPKTSWQVSCDRCWMAGHQEKSCPDRWRQYHLTTDLNNMQTSSDKNTKVYCYNCSAKGHLGYECKLHRMNHYVSPSYPLIARYDLKRLNRNSSSRKQTRKSKCSEKREEKHELRKSKSSPDVGQLQVYSTDGRTIYYSQSQPHMTFSKRHHEDVSQSELSYHRSQGGEADIGSLFRTGVSRRKRCASGHSEDNVEDLYEDLHRHQVHDNEWWHKKTPKKKKKGDKRHNHQYTDSHGGPSNQSPKYELRGTKRHSNWGTEESRQSNKISNEQRDHSYQKNKLKPSTSWPTLKDKKLKNSGGFRARNKNFMAIKSNCDRRMQLRK